MVRFFLTLLLVVNLLVCPMRCFSCVPQAAVAKTGSADVLLAPACSCCPHESELPEPSEPVDCPDQQCQCQDCICDGATLQNSPKLPDSSSPVVFCDGSPNLGALCARHPGYLEAFDGEYSLCGRDMRVAYQSLLN